MFGKKFFKQRMDQPIAARTINQFAGPLDGLMKMRASPGGGLAIQWVAGVPYFRLAGKIQNVFAVTPVGGIPAMTGAAFPYTPLSAVCEIGYFDGTVIKDAGFTAVVWNSTKSIVGVGGKLIQCKVIDGALWADTQDSC